MVDFNISKYLAQTKCPPIQLGGHFSKPMLILPYYLESDPTKPLDIEVATL